MSENGLDALARAKVILGSQQALADAVGVKQPSVHHILTDGKKVPAEWCLPLEKATSGKVTRHQLRPDLYPVEDTAA
jgi:DNA-binding transcriptional regulator YdaS (Cro superfamily)